MKARLVRNFRATLAVGWIFAAACSCRGCHEEGPKTLLALAPDDATGAVWVPDGAAALDQVNAFVERATVKVGADALKRWRGALSKQLGFDPLSKEAYATGGLDPAAGLLAFVPQGGTLPIVAAGVRDADRFDEAVKQVLIKLDTADSVSTRSRNGRTLHTAGRPFGNEVAPALHWAHVGKFVLIAPADALDALTDILDRLGASPAKASLADDATFTNTQSHVPKGEIYLFARTRGTNLPATATLTSVGLGKDGLHGDTYVALPGGGGPPIDLKAALGPDPTLPLAARLDTDAVALALTHAARPEGLRALRSYPAAAPLVDRLLQPLNQSIGLDVEKEVLPLLAGPLTVGVHLAGGGDLQQRLKDVRSLQTFLDAVHVVVTAELTQPERMLQLLERSRIELEKRGAALRKRTDVKVGGKPVTQYEPAVGDAKLSWAVYDKYYVYTAGAGRMPTALERLSKGPSELPAQLEKGVGGELAKAPGSVLVLRGNAIADAAGALATGGDAGSRMGLGALVGSLIELVRTLGDVGISLNADGEGLRLQLRERLQ